MRTFLFRASTFCLSLSKQISNPSLKSTALYAASDPSAPPPGQLLQYAVLVDADNSKASSLEGIIGEVEAMGGESSVRRVYGDFTKEDLSAWMKTSTALSFLPINAFSFGSKKDSADAALIIDAMDLLYTNPSIDGFVLVSSDSNLTRLAQRLREAGKHVVGFGEESPAPFIAACERFEKTSNLGASLPSVSENSKSGASPARSSTIQKKAATLESKIPQSKLELVNKVIDSMGGKGGGWASCDLVTQALVRRDFDPRSFGYDKVTYMFRDNPKLFELRLENDGRTLEDDGCTAWVRRRQE